MLGVVLAVLGAVGPTAVNPAAIDLHECRPGEFPLGPADAPIEIEAFIDPIRADTLTTVLELRRLVGEEDGRLRVNLRLARLMSSGDPQAEHVRRWAAAAALEGGLLLAIRSIERNGIERTYADMVDPSGAWPAVWHGLDAVRIRSSLAGPCPKAALDQAQRDLARADVRTSPLPGPLFVLEQQVIDGDDDLSQLRPAIARTLQYRHEMLRGAPPPPPPALKGVSQALVRPNFASGMILGGAALRHRLLAFVKDEDDPTLFLTLPQALEYRSLHPATVSLHIVARGDSTLTDLLRRRLCAARVMASELEYARYLAKDSNERRSPSKLEAILLDQLDEAAEEHCQPPPNVPLPPSSVPDGPWLDGILRSRGDLENLDTSLYLLDAAVRPLDTLLSPAARPTP